MEISRLLRLIIILTKNLNFSSTHMYTNLEFGHPNYMRQKQIKLCPNYSGIVTALYYRLSD